MSRTARWNTDKRHRCPRCHAIAIDLERPRSLKVYTCCSCDGRFTRWPWLALILPKVGVVCSYCRVKEVPMRPVTTAEEAEDAQW